ncbi:MAG: SdrD B-like domain-containing protein, partial [Actinomycetota bacterium]
TAATCTADGEFDRTGLQAFIYEIDLTGAAPPANLLTVPLDYQKACPGVFGTGDPCNFDPRYFPWEDPAVAGIPTDFRNFVSKAIVSDIEITSNGSLAIGITDRNGNQRSPQNFIPFATPVDPTMPQPVDLDQAFSTNGDMLRACNTSGDPNNPTFELEGGPGGPCDAFANFPDPTGGNNDVVTYRAGPAGEAEFYGDDFFTENGTEGHSETYHGGVYVNRYLDEMAAAAMDPQSFEAGGLSFYDSESGASLRDLDLYVGGTVESGYFGKAAAIGDVEGCFLPLEIGEFVWFDVDGDGVQDPDETPLIGVTVTITGPGLPAGGVTTTTDDDGRYRFGSIDGLAADSDYVISFDASTTTNTTDLPAGLDPALLVPTVNDSSAAGADDDNDSDLVDGQIAASTGVPGVNDHSFDAGFTAPYRIGNLVWLETDDDGIAETGETPLAGVTVELLDAAGAVIDTTTTDADGEYVFDGLAAGTYSVRIPAAGGDNAALLDGFTSAGTPNPDAEGADGAGVDNDNNGVPSAAGFTSGPVTLGPVAGEPTGEVGGIDGASDEGGGYADDRSNLTVDFGFVQPLFSIGSLLWQEVDDDGIAETGETPLAGITVELLDASGSVIATTTTDADGEYRFDDLVAGDYRVRVPDQTGTAGLVSAGTPNADANDDTDNDNNAVPGTSGFTSGVVTLGADAEPTGEAGGIDGDSDENASTPDNRSNQSIDFGFVPAASIGDVVFEDLNRNGQQDPGEVGVPGVTVRLLDESGSVITSTTTDGNGGYRFTDLEPGTYIVEVVAPTDRVFTARDLGEDATDSDVDPATGRTGPIQVEPGDDIDSIDAGLLPLATLPATGSDATTGLLQLAALILLLGGSILAIGRRRPHPTT